MVIKWLARRFQPADRAAMLEEARRLRLEGDLPAARAACLELLRLADDDAGAMALMAALAADERDFNTGRTWATKAIAADSLCVPAHFAMGRLLEGEERFAEAEASYRRVVQLAPDHAAGHTNLGCMLHVQGRIDEAADCYRKALQIQPDQPEALRNYALVAGGAQELHASLEGFERHVAAHPQDAAAQGQLAHLYAHLGRHDAALHHYEQAIALQPDQAEFHFARAQLLLLLGRYEEGWREYEWRWRMELLNGSMRRFSQPVWDGRPLQGQSVLVHDEGGFGDMFQFVRYARMAADRGARVIVECQAAVATLIAGVDGVAQVVAQGQPLPPFDLHLPLICFPGVFGSTVDTLPWHGAYLHADPVRVRQWAERVAAVQPRPRKVGLVWTGNPQNLGNRERSVTLQQLGVLADIPGVTFFSLQKGAEAPAPQDVPAGMHFVDLTESLRDFSDTAALLAQLDLLVTIDTGVAHLAGAMARPTWMLLPASADWRYHVGRSDNPWYPQMRLFRQPVQEDWDTPLQQLRHALQEWAKG